jgi:hypothetical protein
MTISITTIKDKIANGSPPLRYKLSTHMEYGVGNVREQVAGLTTPTNHISSLTPLNAQRYFSPNTFIYCKQ